MTCRIQGAFYVYIYCVYSLHFVFLRGGHGTSSDDDHAAASSTHPTTTILTSHAAVTSLLLLPIPLHLQVIRSLESALHLDRDIIFIHLHFMGLPPDMHTLWLFQVNHEKYGRLCQREEKSCFSLFRTTEQIIRSNCSGGQCLR